MLCVKIGRSMPYSSLPFSPPYPKARNLFKLKHGRNQKIKLLGVFVTALFVLLVAGLLGLVVAFGVVARDLPSPNKLKTRDVALSTKILDRNGELLYDIYGDQNRTLVTLDQVPKEMQNATIAIEDKTFYSHQGFDPVGIARSVKSITFEHDLTGGSTVTQQLVKNALLSSERTISRKFKEFILALMIEQKYNKNEILQMYLNEVSYGGTSAGVEAAASTYFNKHVKELNLVESAILAGLPQKPTVYSPFGPNPKAYLSRTKDVLRRMREDGYLTIEQEEQAKKDLEQIKFAPQGGNIRAPHFVMYVREELVKRYGEKLVLNGGLQVTTSLDLKIQEKAQEIVSKELSKPEYTRLKVGNAATVVQSPKTGEILAMVGSTDYFDEKKDGNVNVTTSLRQPGSSIKPINYVTSFKKGYTPATLLLDIPTEFPGGEGQPPYKPVNYDGKFHGPVQIRYALGNSYNVPAVKALAINTVKDMIDTARDLGINTFTDESRYGLSLTLGGGEVKLVELVNAYSVFANGGQRVDPVSILRVTDPHGGILEEFRTSKGRQVLTPEHAFLITDILSDAAAKYDAFGTFAVNNILTLKGHKVAVKTGTTDDFRDNWTVGYTPSFTVGVWSGNNDNSPMKGIVSGITGAAPVWHALFTEILKDKKAEDFPKPEGIVQAEVDRISGMKPGPYSEKRTEYFAKWQVPQREDDMRKAVKICKPTEKLATDSCLASGDVIEKIYIVLYDPLVKQSCDPCPPTDTDTSYYNPSGKEEPNVKITRPDPGDNLRTEFEVEATVASPYTITKVEFLFNNSLQGSTTVTPYTHRYSLPSSTSPGKHNITVRATDSAGNVGSNSIEINIAPQISSQLEY